LLDRLRYLSFTAHPYAEFRVIQFAISHAPNAVFDLLRLLGGTVRLSQSRNRSFTAYGSRIME
jgi:hypothetical protein